MGQRVVIVDDHAGFRDGARALLLDAGYDVVGEAADGESGRAVVDRTRPDLVLLDVQLPDANGFELAAELSRTAPATRVVLISGREASEYRSRLARSAAPFIPKQDLSVATLAAALNH